MKTKNGAVPVHINAVKSFQHWLISAPVDYTAISEAKNIFVDFFFVRTQNVELNILGMGVVFQFKS